MLLNVILVLGISCSALSLKFDHHTKDKIKMPRYKCHSGPTTTKKIDHHLAECEDEIKIHLLKEALVVIPKVHHPIHHGPPHLTEEHIFHDSPHSHEISDHGHYPKEYHPVHHGPPHMTEEHIFHDSPHIHHTYDDHHPKEHHPFHHGPPHMTEQHIFHDSPHNLHICDQEHHPSYHRAPKKHLSIPYHPQNNYDFDTESFNQFDDQPILDSIHSESKKVEYSEPYVNHPNSHLPESFHTPKESELKTDKDNHRQKRYADYFEYPHSNHQTTLSFQDRRIAGCLLQCVYRKNHAVDSNGWPTLDGLVNFYSDGVHDHDFFIAVLKATGVCLNDGAYKYSIHRSLKPLNGEHCDLSFDVFDCISDKIVDYCENDDHHDHHHDKDHHMEHHDDHHHMDHHKDHHDDHHHDDHHHDHRDHDDHDKHDDHLDHYNHEILFKYI